MFHRKGIKHEEAASCELYLFSPSLGSFESFCEFKKGWEIAYFLKIDCCHGSVKFGMWNILKIQNLSTFKTTKNSFKHSPFSIKVVISSLIDFTQQRKWEKSFPSLRLKNLLTFFMINYKLLNEHYKWCAQWNDLLLHLSRRRVIQFFSKQKHCSVTRYSPKMSLFLLMRR